MMASFPLRNAKTSGVGWVLHLETWVPLLLSLWNILASSNAFMSKVHEQIWNTETINGLLHKTCSKPVFCFGFFKCHIKSYMACKTFHHRKCHCTTSLLFLSFFFFNITCKLETSGNFFHVAFFWKYCIYSATIYSLVFIHKFGIFNRCLLRIGVLSQTMLPYTLCVL